MDDVTIDFGRKISYVSKLPIAGDDGSGLLIKQDGNLDSDAIPGFSAAT